ncbi:MAG: endonuclease/exonuclease/phosphatase family protein [Bacteroidales bacterium]|nr:endonuclease/exonuclease/phosphatase family protein [Bacteroidales bacterium]
MIKRVIGSLALSLALLLTGCSGNQQLKVTTFNIRYDNPGDGPNAWLNRASFVGDFISKEKPDLFGLQETLLHQYEFLRTRLEGYGSVAAGRDDGLTGGEMCPVFYSRQRFELLDSGTFWLSETPDLPGSKGPGAVLPRIVTWVQLREKEGGRKLHFFNTHFSHVSDSARIMSAMILSGAIKNVAGEGFFVLTGDFNLLPESRAYEVLTGVGAPWHVLYDSYEMSASPPSGPSYTFNGFSDKPGEGRIDYIFLPAGTRVLSHQTVVAKQGELFISDHWPVTVTLLW